MKRLLVVVAVLVGLVVIVGAGYFGYLASQPARAAAIDVPPTIQVERGDVQLTVTAPGQLVNTRDDMLGFEVAGRVSKINVQPGSVVHAGDLLAVLDDTTFRYAVETARANLASAEARLEQIKTPPTETEVAAARAAVTSAQAVHDAAVAKYGQRDNQITLARTNLEKMRVDLELAQAAYDRVAYAEDIGMRPESRALQQATIAYQSALADYNLTAAEINDTAVKSAAQTLAQARAALDTLTAPVSRSNRRRWITQGWRLPRPRTP